MKILIRNGRVIDPSSGRDEVADVAIASGRIVSIGKPTEFEAERVFDATGLVVAPGLVDLAARLREPGQEHEGMLESELAAAAAGGVTSLVCPPDTDPVLDEPGLVEMLKFRARKLSRCRVFPLGALTRKLEGTTLTEMAELTEAGCVGFAQADMPMHNTLVLQRALQYAATFGYTVWLRPLDAALGQGVAAQGAVATRLGLSGVPVLAETIALHTLFELVRATGARVHLCRLSSAAGVALLRAAKAQGLPVTADVSINSLHLTDIDIGYFNPDMRLQPPLRQGADRDALRKALADGTIDALVSDHNPVADDMKNLPFGEAEPGATGLELLLSLALRWGQDSGLPLATTLSRVTSAPVRVMGDALGSLASSAGRLVEGGVADVCVFDPAAEWAVAPALLVSQGKHTPFSFASTGMALPGRVRATLVAGTLAFEASADAGANANASASPQSAAPSH
jgi:dihydroorotase